MLSSVKFPKHKRIFLSHWQKKISPEVKFLPATGLLSGPLIHRAEATWGQWKLSFIWSWGVQCGLLWHPILTEIGTRIRLSTLFQKSKFFVFVFVMQSWYLVKYCFCWNFESEIVRQFSVSSPIRNIMRCLPANTSYKRFPYSPSYWFTGITSLQFFIFCKTLSLRSILLMFGGTRNTFW